MVSSGLNTLVADIYLYIRHGVIGFQLLEDFTMPSVCVFFQLKLAEAISHLTVFFNLCSQVCSLLSPVRASSYTTQH